MGYFIPSFFLVVQFLAFRFSYGNPLDDYEHCKPQQVHIAVGNSVAEMVVMWSTLGQCSTMVKYGVLPNTLNLSAPGESRMFESDWNKDGVKTIHMVKLRGLTPKMSYYYKPSSNEISVGPFYFTTSAADQSQSVQLMAISDLNTTSPHMVSLLQEAGSGQYNAILHAGNIAMKLSDDGGQNADRYLRLMEMAVKSVPYMTAPGPLETDGDTFAQYTHRFAMPKSEWPMPLDRLWYSVDIGLVHLVSFSTEVFFTNNGKYTTPQHNWLIKDLKVANENRHRVPWIVAFGHRPLYCTSRDPELVCGKEKSTLRTSMEDMLFHYGVDLVVSSYGENYERSYPMFKGIKLAANYSQPLGPVYVTLGAASPFENAYNFTTPEEWSAFRIEDDSVQSFGRLYIQNASILTFEQVSLANNDVIDTFTIVQESHGKFNTEKLPANVSAIINKQIIEAGGSPDDMNIKEISSPKPETTKSQITKLIEDIKTGKENKKIIIGGAVAGGVLLLIITLLVVRRVCRNKRRRSSRRWEHMDINYGKRYYSKASDKDDMENDFEIDIPETTEPSRKLLTDD